jgi:enterochelin esterase-like enzyme
VGTVVRLPLQQASPTVVDVWLPPDYDQGQRHPVIYAADGQMLFDAALTWNHQCWQLDSALWQWHLRTGQPTPLVVALYNIQPGRRAQYFPGAAMALVEPALRDSLLYRAPGRGQDLLFGGPLTSDRFMRWVVDTLKPWIDVHYRTLPDPAHTLAMGSSMGGLWALNALLSHPQVFGHAGCLSTHWLGAYTTARNPLPDALLTWLERNLPPPHGHRIYMAYGVNGLDSLYHPYQHRAETIIRKAGYTDDHFESWIIAGGGHSERDWSLQVPDLLRFLLQPPPE